LTGISCRRASLLLAVLSLLFFTLSFAHPALSADEAAPPAKGGVDTNFACFGCHSKKEITPWITRTWAESLHAAKGVKCPDCHGNHDLGFDSKDFTALPGPEVCMKCHPLKVKETLASKHSGVVKCTSCHPRHTFSLAVARNPEICMTCHVGSNHVQSYSRSKMGVVYRTMGPGYSATCQTCHMPDKDHNVNDTIENKELMLKVCNACHSASFAGKVLSEGAFRTHW
jgi:hypothetical protein